MVTGHAEILCMPEGLSIRSMPKSPSLFLLTVRQKISSCSFHVFVLYTYTFLGHAYNVHSVQFSSDVSMLVVDEQHDWY